jgi:hypothetical protein
MTIIETEQWLEVPEDEALAQAAGGGPVRHPKRGRGFFGRIPTTVWVSMGLLAIILPIEAARMLVSIPSNQRIDRRIESALGEMPAEGVEHPPSEELAALQQEVALLRAQLNLLHGSGVSSSPLASVESGKALEPSWQYQEVKRFWFAPGTDTGEVPLSIPAGYIQPVKANLAAGQTMAISVPAGVDVVVYSPSGGLVPVNNSGTWDIPAGGDTVIDFMARAGVSGVASLTVK